MLVDSRQIAAVVDEVVDKTRVFDMHTHLFAPRFSSLNLYGIDELLNYHYLIAELFRSAKTTPGEFWSLDRTAQADLIWKTLFLENTPLSEATRGVIAVLSAFGLDTAARNLNQAREFFTHQSVVEHFDRVFQIARVSDIVMTNDPLDKPEMRFWAEGGNGDPRFHAAVRMDGILNEWETKHSLVEGLGYNVSKDISGPSVSELRRFLDVVIDLMHPVYLAVSLPNSFAYPEDSIRSRLITELVLPACREHSIPFALMIGVKRSVNPALKLAGDGVGRASIEAVERLCADNPDNRFLVTMLSRENQHELCVSARKFANLMPFGCWWFLNNPSIIEEITRERIELLGASFIPQHSDARVLEHLIYKWQHSRRVISRALSEAYNQLLVDGRPISRSEIERDVRRLFCSNFTDFTNLSRAGFES